MQFILLHFREKLVSFSNSYNKRAVIKNVLVGSGDSDLNQNYALVYEVLAASLNYDNSDVKVKQKNFKLKLRK